MQKVTSYCLVVCSDVKEYINEGWQPWGSAIISWDGNRNSPHQSMVRYEEKVVRYEEIKGD